MPKVIKKTEIKDKNIKKKQTKKEKAVNIDKIKKKEIVGDKKTENVSNNKKNIAEKRIINAKQLWLDSREILKKKFNYKSIMQVPRLEKIVINAGVKVENSKKIGYVVKELEMITGQKPIIRKARKSESSFGLRKGQEIGVMVTLRGEKMFIFYDKFVNFALPNVPDFSGINPNSFDGRGNLSIGVREQLIFLEISFDNISFIQGYDITFVTTAKNNEEGRELFKMLKMPFRSIDN